jgi:hypothetical protein
MSAVQGETMVREYFLYIIGVMFVIAFLIEAILLLYLFTTADSVDCNWIFCTFTKTSSSVTEVRNLTISQSVNCWKNGVEINCTEFGDYT